MCLSLLLLLFPWGSTYPDCLLLYCFPSQPDSTIEYLCRVLLWFFKTMCFLLLSAAGVSPTGPLVCALTVYIVISFINGHLFSVNSISAAGWAKQQGGRQRSINTHTHTRPPDAQCMQLYVKVPPKHHDAFVSHCLPFLLSRERGSWEWVMSVNRQTLWSDSKIKTRFISLDIPWFIIELLQICISVLVVPMHFDAIWAI